MADYREDYREDYSEDYSEDDEDYYEDHGIQAVSYTHLRAHET